jgi:hypothetical protein
MRAKLRVTVGQAADLGFNIGAGDENRTRTISLGNLSAFDVLASR